jgi:hypothetical protein
VSSLHAGFRQLLQLPRRFQVHFCNFLLFRESDGFREGEGNWKIATAVGQVLRAPLVVTDTTDPAACVTLPSAASRHEVITAFGRHGRQNGFSDGEVVDSCERYRKGVARVVVVVASGNRFRSDGSWNAITRNSEMSAGFCKRFRSLYNLLLFN